MDPALLDKPQPTQNSGPKKKKKKKNPFLAIYKDPVPSCDLSTLKATFPLGQKKALTPM
jgi:hypothetical protein